MPSRRLMDEVTHQCNPCAPGSIASTDSADDFELRGLARPENPTACARRETDQEVAAPVVCRLATNPEYFGR
jgi:hypothetical protein